MEKKRSETDKKPKTNEQVYNTKAAKLGSYFEKEEKKENKVPKNVGSSLGGVGLNNHKPTIIWANTCIANAITTLQLPAKKTSLPSQGCFKVVWRMRTLSGLEP